MAVRTRSGLACSDGCFPCANQHRKWDLFQALLFFRGPPSYLRPPPTMMILNRFMRMVVARSGPSYMEGGSAWAGQIGIQHELRIDLAVERLTCSRTHGECALWGYLALEAKCRQRLEHAAKTLANVQIR